MHNQPFSHGFWKAAGAIPLVVVLALIPVLTSRDSGTAMEAPLLLAWLSTIFLGGVPLALAFLAARSFQATGARLFLMLGCGLLSFGVSSLLAGWAMPVSGHPNATVTLHNLGCLVAGAYHLLGAHYVLAELGGVLRPRFHVRRAAVPYLSILAFWAVVLLLVLHDKLPAFFVPGYGPTPLRQFVLGGALFMFALSGVLFLELGRILKTDFAYWYGLALLMIAGGLAFVLLQPVVGGILGWAGRSAQYLGSLYFICALWRGRVEFRRASQVSAPATPAMFWPYLEQQVKERTSVLEQANENLRREIAERKQLEEEREITLRLLRLLNSPRSLPELMREILVALQEWTGCQAVGIRLREGADFPYLETRGFPPEFVSAENSLCQRDSRGELVCDGQGNPVLECMCGNVLCGRFNPSLPFFTERGSFWTNSTTELLAGTSPADRQARTRNRCHGEGYESVALIALRTGGEAHGLLQFNDRRTGRFTPPLIAVLERLADNLASGVAHRQLLHQLKFQALLLDQISDTVLATDLNGRVTFVNAAQCRALNRSPEELLETAWEVGVKHPAPVAIPSRILEATRAQGAWRGELTHQGDGGRERIVDCRTTLIKNEAGHPIGICATGTDITARILLRRALEDEATRRRLLFEQSRDGIVVLDQTGKVYEANRRFAEMLGYSMAEIAQLHVWDWDAQWTREELLEQIRRVDAAGDFFETRHRRKDGGMLDMEISTNSLEWEGRKQVFCVCRDITGRKLADEALRESETRFRHLLHNVPSIGVQGYGMDGTVQYWNQASELLYGYTAREAIGRNLVDLIIPPEMRAEVKRAVEGMAKTGQPIPASELSLMRKDGSRVEVFSSHVLVQKPGRELELFCIDIDITERKRAEAELRASHEQLRALATRVQAAREEERCRIAREIHDVLAQELTRLKIDLAWLQRRLSKPLEPGAARQMSARVTEMTQAADAAITCVQEIATELRPVVLDSLGLAAAVEWHVRDFQRRTGIQCEASVPEEDVPLGQERATVVYRILQETLTNVARHARASRVEVNLRHEAGWVILTVRDNGRGMEAKTLDNPLSIGLAGMRERAALPGGQLEITSQPGAGTVVAARIPVG